MTTGLLRGLLFLLASLPVLAADPLAPHLSEADKAEISQILASPPGDQNRERLEIRYARLLQRQIFSDLLLLYSKEQASQVKIAYSAFIPEDSERPGADAGYGFHVLRRLRLKLSNGTEKQIDVNEHWPEDRNTHGLFLPDEIRVKSFLLAESDEDNFLFDSLRLTWGEEGVIGIYRRSLYRFDAQLGKLMTRKMRSKVTGPFVCAACHRPKNPFSADFKAPDERLHPQTIVADSFFALPLTKQFGYRSYLDYLTRERADSGFLKRVVARLQDPQSAFALPGIEAALKREIAMMSFNWLGDDIEMTTAPTAMQLKQQGIYRSRTGQYFLDALENEYNGKYGWWDPVPVLP